MGAATLVGIMSLAEETALWDARLAADEAVRDIDAVNRSLQARREILELAASTKKGPRSARRRLKKLEAAHKKAINEYHKEVANTLVDDPMVDDTAATARATQASAADKTNGSRRWKPKNATTHHSTHRTVGSADDFGRQVRRKGRRRWRDSTAKVAHELAFVL